MSRQVEIKGTNTTLSEVLNSIYLGLPHLLASPSLLYLDTIVRHCGNITYYKTVTRNTIVNGIGQSPLPQFYSKDNYQELSVHPLTLGRDTYTKARNTLIDLGLLHYQLRRPEDRTDRSYNNYLPDYLNIVEHRYARFKDPEFIEAMRISTSGLNGRSPSTMKANRDRIKRYSTYLQAHGLYKGVSYAVVCMHRIVLALCSYVGSLTIYRLSSVLHTILGGKRSDRQIRDVLSEMIASHMLFSMSNRLSRIDVAWGIDTGTEDPLKVIDVYYS